MFTGGPGVGRTRIVGLILRIPDADAVKLVLCAPIGRAAKRMTKTTGSEVMIIHLLLEFDPKGFGFKRADESRFDCHFLAGDVDQLPSVGPGSGTVPMLGGQGLPPGGATQDHRRRAPHQRLRLPDPVSSHGKADFYFVPAAGPDQAVVRVVELVSQRIPRRFGLRIREMRVLCPMNRAALAPGPSTLSCRRP